MVKGLLNWKIGTFALFLAALSIYPLSKGVEKSSKSIENICYTNHQVNCLNATMDVYGTFCEKEYRKNGKQLVIKYLPPYPDLDKDDNFYFKLLFYDVSDTNLIAGIDTLELWDMFTLYVLPDANLKCGYIKKIFGKEFFENDDGLKDYRDFYDDYKDYESLPEMLDES